MNDLLDCIVRTEPADELLSRFLNSVFDEHAVQREGNAQLRPRIEDVFTLLESAIESPTPIVDRWLRIDLADVWRHLVARMGRVIGEAGTAEPGPAALRFVEVLPKERSTIISTNYDICMDNALLAAGNVNYGFTVRFAVGRLGGIPEGREEEMRYYRPLPGEQPYIRRGTVPLLKLHGSLNWLYCDRCRELDITLEEHGGLTVLDTPQFGRCGGGACTSQYEPVIAGPSFVRRYRHPYLRRAWGRADLALRDAERLVIIGYSLPESDYRIRCMLANHFAKRSEFVEVVYLNPEAEGEVDEQLEARYRRIFPRCSFRSDGFGFYVQDMPPQARGANSGDPALAKG